MLSHVVYTVFLGVSALLPEHPKNHKPIPEPPLNIFSQKINWPDEMPERSITNLRFEVRMNAKPKSPQKIWICLEGNGKDPFCSKPLRLQYQKGRYTGFVKKVEDISSYQKLSVYQDMNLPERDTLDLQYLHYTLTSPRERDYIFWVFEPRYKTAHYSVFYGGIDSTFSSKILDKGAFLSQSNLAWDLHKDIFGKGLSFSAKQTRLRADSLQKAMISEISDAISYFRAVKKETQELKKFHKEILKLQEKKLTLARIDTSYTVEEEYDKTGRIPQPVLDLYYTSSVPDQELQIHIEQGEPDQWISAFVTMKQNGKVIWRYRPEDYAEFGHSISHNNGKLFLQISDSGVQVSEGLIKNR